MSKLEKNLNIDSIEKIDNADRNSDIKIEEHLSDDFKNNLVKMMTEEYEKDEKESIKEDSKTNKLKRLFYKNNNNYKNRRSYSFPKRLAILFTLFIIVSGVTFGKNFTSLVAKIFSNQDKSVDLAIENGYYQNIDMDYIFHDGVGIKVDYVYADESCIYIAFNVESEEEFDVVSIDEIIVRNKKSVIYDTNSNNELVLFKDKLKRLSKKNSIYIVELYSVDTKFEKANDIEINISKVMMENNGTQRELINDWNYTIKVNDFFSTEEIQYKIDAKALIDDYKISLKGYKLSITLFLKNDKVTSLNRNDVYIENENGEVFYCNDFYIYNENKIKIIIPLNTNEYNNLKLIIKLKDTDKNLVFYLKKEDSQ